MLAGSDVKVSFTPHLLPLNRGILSTMYASLKKTLSTDDLIDLYKNFYNNELFIRVLRKGMYPNVSSVKGTNSVISGSPWIRGQTASSSSRPSTTS